MPSLGKPTSTNFDAKKLSRLLAYDRQAARLAKEDAAELKFRLWRERLLELRVRNGRDVVLDEAINAGLSLALADCADIQLFHSRPRGLILAAQQGLRAPFLDFFHFVNDGTTACGMALHNRRSVAVPDITNSPIYSHGPAVEVLLDAGIRAVQSAPLIDSQGHMLGVLSVLYRQPRDHSATDVGRFTRLATVVADVLNGRTKCGKGKGM